ncbi:hypothetical protein [Pedobacter sp. GR22-6]|uniref:hypothetical protein n=1 Tax=Pedobacter sp. GR22-6 TaxID=3127957 RepID=UPI00307F4573
MYLLKIKNLLTILLSMTSQVIFSQELPKLKNPPVILETMVGSRGTYAQMMISKKFHSIPNLGIFTVNSIIGEWGQNRVDDMMMQGHVTYGIYKGFTVNAGFHYTPMTGMRPTAGVMYTFASPLWTIVLFPRTDISSTPDMEMFGMVEHKPKINQKINLYSRVQGMYVNNPKSYLHQKSGIAIRTGVTYREFTFGAAFSSDWYGQERKQKSNLGGFLSLAL